VDQPGDLTEAGCLLDEGMNGLPVGYIDRCDAHVVAGVA
jgi:hypothetical protein